MKKVLNWNYSVKLKDGIKKTYDWIYKELINNNLNTKKRPVSAVADNLEFRNIKSVIIKTNNLVKFKLLYDKNNSLAKKIKLEQIRKQTL